MSKFTIALIFILQLIIFPININANAIGHVHVKEAKIFSGPQLAEKYKANLLSLTDAAQIIEFLAEFLEKDKNVNKNAMELEKLNRITFWTCSGFAEPNDGNIFHMLQKEVAPKWQDGYSKRLCQNMYKLLAMVDIELMMFTTKLNEEVNNEHFFGFLHWDEKHVRDVDLHNFKLSRMFAFARNLTIRFMQLASNTKIFHISDEYVGKSIDKKHYIDLLHRFNGRTEELLTLISHSTKFKTAQHESFWSWLKNKKEKVQRKLDDKIKEKKWFQKDYEMLISIYEAMELVGVQDKPKLDEIYGKKKAWYQKIFEHESDKEHNGMLDLFTQSPWFFPRIHKMVDIFAQLQELDGHHGHPPVIKGLKRTKSEIANEEAEMREHPELWKIIDLERHKAVFNKPKLTEYNILKLLKLFETEEFEKLKENTEKNGFESFFDVTVNQMVDLSKDDDVLEAVRKIILEKVDKAVDGMNLVILRTSGLEIPVELGTELLSYQEQNVFTLGAFYKFCVQLAKQYKKIRNIGNDTQDKTIDQKLKSFFEMGGHAHFQNNLQHNEHSSSRSMNKPPSMDENHLIKIERSEVKNNLKKNEANGVSRHNFNVNRFHTPLHLNGHLHSQHRGLSEILAIAKRSSGFNHKFMEAMKSIGLPINGPKVDQHKPENAVIIFQYKFEELKDEIIKNGLFKMLKSAMIKGKSNLLEEINFGVYFCIPELKEQQKEDEEEWKC